MIDIDTRLEALEQADGASVPGTSLTRILMDVKLFAKYGLGEPSTDAESVTLWCLGIGAPWKPKYFFYGCTIVEALEKAEEAFELILCDYCNTSDDVVFVAEANSWFCPTCLRVEQEKASR